MAELTDGQLEAVALCRDRLDEVLVDLVAAADGGGLTASACSALADSLAEVNVELRDNFDTREVRIRRRLVEWWGPDKTDDEIDVMVAAIMREV